jgi:hypothetical protein
MVHGRLAQDQVHEVIREAFTTVGSRIFGQAKALDDAIVAPQLQACPFSVQHEEAFLAENPQINLIARITGRRDGARAGDCANGNIGKTDTQGIVEVNLVTTI